MRESQGGNPIGKALVILILHVPSSLCVLSARIGAILEQFVSRCDMPERDSVEQRCAAILIPAIYLSPGLHQHVYHVMISTRCRTVSRCGREVYRRL